jgi:hypothetical protein
MVMLTVVTHQKAGLNHNTTSNWQNAEFPTTHKQFAYKEVPHAGTARVNFILNGGLQCNLAIKHDRS